MPGTLQFEGDARYLEDENASGDMTVVWGHLGVKALAFLA